jgi:hypothetical protein
MALATGSYNAGQTGMVKEVLDGTYKQHFIHVGHYYQAFKVLLDNDFSILF